MPRLYALQFDLVTQSPCTTSVIVWPETPTGLAHPANEQQDLLDVRAGDDLLVADRRRKVTAVRVYRGDGAGGETPVVECGRAWIG